jgi:hypothetical protein
MEQSAAQLETNEDEEVNEYPTEEPSPTPTGKQTITTNVNSLT